MGVHSEIVAGKPAEQKQTIHAMKIAAHKTLSAPELPFSPYNVMDRGGGLELCMQSKLEYLLFCSMWETYFHMHFQSSYGHLKALQSF
jgi:hypothetical protein